MRMVWVAVAIASSAIAVAQPQGQSQNDPRYPQVVYLGSTLTVSEIIRLSRDGISDNAIIRQITTSGQAFHLSSNDLVRLKNARVSDKVIAAMLNPPVAAVSPSATQEQAPQPSTIVPATQPPPSKQTVSRSVPATPTQAVPSSPARPDPILSTVQPDLPTEPGLYFLAGHERTKILGQPVSFERTGSRLVNTLTLNIKAAHDNIQLPGQHAQTTTGTKPVFAFVPSRNEIENGVTAGDLLLLKLETHGDRRQIEIAAEGSWRESKGVSITHQLQALRSEPTSGVYELTPADPLAVGEYAVYLQRGEGLPALLYDFSVQNRH